MALAAFIALDFIADFGMSEQIRMLFTHYAHVAARASGASKHAGIQCDERKHQSGMIEEVAFFREDLGATLSLRRSTKHQMA